MCRSEGVSSTHVQYCVQTHGTRDEQSYSYSGREGVEGEKGRKTCCNCLIIQKNYTKDKHTCIHLLKICFHVHIVCCAFYFILKRNVMIALQRPTDHHLHHYQFRHALGIHEPPPPSAAPLQPSLVPLSLCGSLDVIDPHPIRCDFVVVSMAWLEEMCYCEGKP